MLKHFGVTKTERLLNIIELCGIILMLFMAFAFEVIYRELPCPLCLLQRVGFLCVALGFLMNLRFGLRPSHYSIVIISALFTSVVALRQIFLHIVPGTGAYGSPVFGYHLYTWSFIFSMLIVVVTTIMLGIDRQYQSAKRIPLLKSTQALFAIVLFLVLMNLLSVFMECGFRECPDNPTHFVYLLNSK
ncbi:MAG: disulfide bond formation protein B [Gammaproteobacteria bacterium]